MENPGTQNICNSFFFFLILLKIKKIETHPHAEQRLQACSIYCTAETNKLKIQDYQNEHIHCI